MNLLALLLVVMLVFALAMHGGGRWSRLVWEITVTVILVLLLIGNIA